MTNSTGLATRISPISLTFLRIPLSVVKNQSHEAASAKDFEAMGVKKMDALHLASAEAASCDWFFTTDKGILKKVREIGEMRVANPVEFVTWRRDDD